MRRSLRAVADATGRGLLAGLVGTAAMTLSSTVEERLTGRGASTTPADAAERLSGLHPSDEETRQRFSMSVHWTYGICWGAPRAVLGLAGLRGACGSLVHLALVWGSEQAVLPCLAVGEPVWKYGVRATATDGVHHLVFATVTGLVSDWLGDSHG